MSLMQKQIKHVHSLLQFPIMQLDSFFTEDGDMSLTSDSMVGIS